MSIKVFFSDVHLSDTTTGDHNITAGTLEGFWSDIQGDVDNAGGTKKLEIIILGDFIDVIRSTQWTGDMQPWSEASKKKKERVDEVLSKVIKKNKSVFDTLKGYVEEKKVKITYIMGNHDRLINSEGYEDMREKIRDVSGISYTQSKGEPFPWEYRVDGLPVYAVHGNNYDVYNKTENDVLPVGDAIVTLLINQYPEEVNKIIDDPDVFDALQEIDNLRPSTMTPYWIDQVKKSLKPKNQKILIDTWNILSDKFFHDAFVKEWLQKHDYWSLLPDDADKLEIAFKHFTDTTLERVYEKFLEIKRDFIKDTDKNALEALKLCEQHQCDYVLFGHTHESCVQLLNVEDGKEKYYVNTGTWRRRIVPGGYKKKQIVFGQQESIDYVIFKIDDQSNEVQGFQLWNGTSNRGELFYKKEE
ncbi:MAG: hypothetical protein DCC43_11320 [Candidatus Brocadia sp.]|nr:hypothetical protein [Candidatus Brocadia fulgida]MCC6325663.1 metallophosphoesterase [Candidatus Brocadia sp.]MCE7912541.1 hypothetical protein [Candidatus Brocadia sp. AMX3]MDG5997741.1 hypothetical protein [Candidatus Brocadia sp.]RIJ95840.1 MAG: hypothetical protein DCC43_11320 [Candidatus Brocadia sp.]